MLADVYWIRAIQYFAATRLKNKPTGPRDLLFPLLDITTSLDPAFNLAYRFGAIFLAERHRGGTFQPELAIKLLDKGFAQNPTRWEYLYDKAFVYYWTFHDPEGRRALVRRSGQGAGLGRLAARACGDHAGRRRRSAELAVHVPADAADRRARVPCETTPAFRLAQLDILDAIDQLNAILDRYQQVTGTRATTWAPLVARNWLRAAPADPDGKPFTIDSSGRAALDPASKFNPLPIEPASKPPAPDADGANVPRPPA